MLIGAVLIVPFPFAAVGIAAWWLAADLGRPRRRYPGRLGIGALVLLALAGAVVATFVIGFHTHFDCGGTLGDFGAGASAELDESCVDARAWRTPALTAVMSGAAVPAALTIGRATGIGPEHQADDREDGPPRRWTTAPPPGGGGRGHARRSVDRWHDRVRRELTLAEASGLPAVAPSDGMVEVGEGPSLVSCTLRWSGRVCQGVGW